MKYNISEIMKQAHTLTRNALEKATSAAYNVTFAESLKIAWEDAKRISAAQEWANMDGGEQLDALTRMVYHYKRRADAQQDTASAAAWIVTADDARTAAAEAWIEIQTQLATANDNTPLPVVMYRAVSVAVRRIDRQERRNARAICIEEADEAKRAYIIDNAAPMADPIAPAPEVYAGVRDAILRAAIDGVDADILHGLAAGYTQTMISQIIGIPVYTVSRRISRMSERYHAQERTA